MLNCSLSGPKNMFVYTVFIKLGTVSIVYGYIANNATETAAAARVFKGSARKFNTIWLRVSSAYRANGASLAAVVAERSHSW